MTTNQNKPAEEQKAEHSAEPWRIARSEIIPADDAFYDSDGKYIDPHLKANARRIVACVNFCAGVPNKTLEEIGTLNASISSLINEVGKLDGNNIDSLRAQLSVAQSKVDWVAKWHKCEVCDKSNYICDKHLSELRAILNPPAKEK